MEKKSTKFSGYNSVLNAQATEQLQWTKYQAKQGHGFAAEDMNALCDAHKWKKVDKVGLNNELNGADRIVNGVAIQTKYCRTASHSVNAAFKDGAYRYSGQKLEVPRDQYKEAVRLMGDKIREGKVPGVTDPAKAKGMVIKGKVTYAQAVRIAKAGNIDSIKFDIKSQRVNCRYAMGLSFVVSFTAARLRGESFKEAMSESISQAVRSGILTMASGVAAQQLLRTTVGRSIAAATTQVARQGVGAICKTKIGSDMVKKTMSAMLGKQMTMHGAKSAATKLLRTNVVTGAVTTVVTSVPDMWKTSKGKMSLKQCGKNMTVNAVGVTAGTTGYWAGSAIGTAICPGVGTVVGGLIGSIGGGMAGTVGAKKALDKVIEDDAQLISRHIENVIEEMAIKHEYSDKDLRDTLQEMKEKKLFNNKFFEDAYQVYKNKGTEMLRNYLWKQFEKFFFTRVEACVC